MLVLRRKAGEIVNIDSMIKVTVVAISGNRVRLGIEAPKDISIVRGELLTEERLTSDRSKDQHAQGGQKEQSELTFAEFRLEPSPGAELTE